MEILQTIMFIVITIAIIFYIIKLLRTWPDFKIFMLLGGIIFGPFLIFSAFLSSGRGTEQAMKTATTMMTIGFILPVICLFSIIGIMINRWLKNRKANKKH